MKKKNRKRTWRPPGGALTQTMRPSMSRYANLSASRPETASGVILDDESLRSEASSVLGRMRIAAVNRAVEAALERQIKVIGLVRERESAVADLLTDRADRQDRQTHDLDMRKLRRRGERATATVSALEAEARAQALEQAIAMEQLTFGEQLEARRREFQSYYADEEESEQEEHERVTKDVASHFSTLQQGLRNAVALREQVATTRTELEAIYGAAEAKAIMRDALKLANLDDSSLTRQGGWTAPGEE